MNFEDKDTPYPKGTRFSGTKERVIGTALKYIANEGGDDFSLNKILKLAGVSKGSFFHHFKNADDLLLACFDECKSFTRINFGADETSQIHDLLMAFGSETLRHTTSYQFLRLFMFFGKKSASDERYQEKQRELTELYVESLSSVIQKMNPCLDPRKIREAVGFLLIVNQGVATHRVHFKDRERMESVWPHAVNASLGIMGHDCRLPQD